MLQALGKRVCKYAKKNNEAFAVILAKQINLKGIICFSGENVAIIHEVMVLQKWSLVSKTKGSFTRTISSVRFRSPCVSLVCRLPLDSEFVLRAQYYQTFTPVVYECS
jgi:hypothetical protein